MAQNIVKGVKSLIKEANEVVDFMTVDEVKKIFQNECTELEKSA